MGDVPLKGSAKMLKRPTPKSLTKEKLDELERFCSHMRWTVKVIEETTATYYFVMSGDECIADTDSLEKAEKICAMHNVFPQLIKAARENERLRRHNESLKGHIRLLESPEYRGATISKTY